MTEDKSLDVSPLMTGTVLSFILQTAHDVQALVCSAYVSDYVLILQTDSARNS